MADWEPYLRDVPEEHRETVRRYLEQSEEAVAARMDVERRERKRLAAMFEKRDPWHWRDERCEVCGEWVPVTRERPVEHVLCFEHRGNSDGPS